MNVQPQSPLVHLIDDDQAVRDSLALLIGTVGLRVQAWADPQAFLAGFDRSGIGAIVLDVRMPGIGGLTVLDRLVAQGVGAAVVPKLAVQDGTYPRIVLIALAQPTVRRSFALLSRKGTVLSPAAQALYRLILSMAKSARGRRVQAG